jgi:hypothetical protein
MPNIPSIVALTRIGFAARGIMYLVIGYLALRTGHGEDGTGALDYLNGSAGRLLLGAMAIGFLAYACWRLSEAVIDSEGHGSDARGRIVRAGGVASGIVHFVLFFYAAKLASGSGDGGGSGGTEERAADAMALPGGELLLILVAAAIAGTGAYQMVKAVRAGFLDHLDPQAARQAWVKWLGRAGYAARGLVFLTMGWLIFQAARASDAGKAGDMGQAIDAIPASVRTLVAAGLLLFGLFSLVEAVYRRINDPKVLARLRSAAHAV